MYYNDKNKENEHSSFWTSFKKTNPVGPPRLVRDDMITVLINGKTHTVNRDEDAALYTKVHQIILGHQWDKLEEALSFKVQLHNMSEGQVQLKGNQITYKGEEINNSAVNKLMNLLKAGLKDPRPWLRFLDKLLSNPSMNSREQLYKFLEHENMPLTEDGNVIGYKGVQEDYYSVHGGTNSALIQGKHNASGQIFNGEGCTIEMVRDQVDDNINHGCSAGLHIGSHNYADSWGHNGKLMIVEFNPKDAVSVPHCSSYEKLRVCKYTVVGESTDRQKLNEGLYGHSGEERGNEIMDYLWRKWRKGKRPSFRKLTRKFPGINTGELNDALQTHGEYDAGLHWEDELNEYVIIQSGQKDYPDDDL